MSQFQGLEYPDVAEALRRASVSVDAADCHGLICGLICAAGFADQKIWVAEIFEAYDPKDLLQAEAYRLLQRLYEEKYYNMWDKFYEKYGKHSVPLPPDIQ